MPDSVNLDGYSPSPAQRAQAEELRDLLREADLKNLKVSLIGGYGLDTLYGKLTRDHHDFDLLVEGGSRDGFVELLLKRGYAAAPEQFDPRRNKEAYHHASTGWQVEFAALDASLLEVLGQRHGFHAELALFFPEERSGRLMGSPVRVPTMAGMEIVEKVQQDTAREKSWAGYKHTQHRAALLEALKKKG